MSTKENKALVRRLIEEFWNQGHFAFDESSYAPNCIFHDPSLPQVRTPKDYEQWATHISNAFPDFHFTIEDIIAEGDKVMTRWTVRGTHTGVLATLMPLPATGKQVTVMGMTISHLAGGKFVEFWNLWDIMGLMQQLGVMPTMG